MTSVSKHAYIVELVGIVNKNNNTYHHIMNSVDVNSSTFVFKRQITFVFKIARKTLNIKLRTMYKYQYIKTFLKKVMVQTGRRKSLRIKKVKYTVLETYVIGGLNGEKSLEIFMKRYCKNQIK